MKLSVVIPTKNEEANVGACLDAFAAFRSETELIVVDNSSPDKTRDIAAAKGAKVLVQGPERCAQRNRGWREASGDYVMFVDADMIVPEETITEIVESSNRRVADCLYVREVRSGAGLRLKARNFERSFYDGTCIDGLRVIRRDWLEKVGGYDENLVACEDWDLDRRLLAAGTRTAITKGHLVHNETKQDLGKFLKKKAYYSTSVAAYRSKWHEDEVIRKQFGLGYRFFGVFVENGKWRRLLRHPILAAVMYAERVLVGFTYLLNREKEVKGVTMKRLMLWAIALVGASLSWGGAEDVAPFNDDPAKYWNLDELSKTPSYRVSPHAESDWKGLQALLVKGKGPKGAEAEFFAYYGRPEGPVPEGGFPGVVLVHGGGGTAYPNYTEEWVKEGFAVLALDWYNQRPAMGLTNASPTEVSVPRVPLAGGRRQDHVANVANMVLAHSLLRSFPEVNRDRTVFVGLSWGSWYGAIVAAVDDRFKGCVEIYCGDKDVGRAGGRALINGRFLHAAKVPMWWAVSTNDKNVTPYTSQAGWDACAKFSGATIVNRLPHSHVGFTFPSVKRVAKHFAGLAKPLPRLVAAKIEGDCVTARIADPGDGVVRATLNYTLSSDPKTDLRRWESVPAEICGETVRATLPAGAVQCYLSAYEAGTSRFDDLCGSTAFLTPAPTAAKEEPYAFRKRLETVHEPNRRDPSLQPTADEFAFADGMAVGDADFADYLRTSMNVKATEGRRGAVWTAIDGSLREREYEIEVRKEGVEIRAADKRTLHQAYYHLEDLMNLRRAPFLKFGKERRRSRFSPRMVHSGWALDKFPDGHLLQMAHAGLDAILIFVKDADTTQGGGAHAGVNDIIDRALACGIDTYLYSKVRGFAHPDDPKGAELLRESFGRVAAAHPRAKGVVFVGESCEFPSRDERTCGLSYKDKRPAGETRPLPGWFPCRDYPDWLNAVKTALHENAPDMEIVFWTYNWSRQPPELCADLIPHFPDGVAVQGTFGKGENLVHRNGLENRCCDYTISEPGPTRHFAAEATAAKKGGRKLYAMTNTGGMTWDYGVVPYQPCPYQWKKRWDALARAQKEWGLSGLMESHHYGWHPSFISELAKEAYTEGGMPFDEHIRKIAARDFGEENADAVLAIWKRWSEAAADYVATNENQYGPFRLGPAYPFNFGGEPIREGEFPQDPSATHVMRWMAYLNYPYDQQAADMLNITFSPLPGGERGREKELALMESMYAAWNDGAAQLHCIAATLDPFRRAVAERQAGVGEWHARTILTALNLKRGYAAFAKGDKAKLLEYARAEYANAHAAIKLVERDSRLGWEPSMEYGAGVPQLRWKIERMKLVFGENELK